MADFLKHKREAPMMGCSVRSFGKRLCGIQGEQFKGCLEKAFSRLRLYNSA